MAFETLDCQVEVLFWAQPSEKMAPELLEVASAEYSDLQVDCLMQWELFEKLDSAAGEVEK